MSLPGEIIASKISDDEILINEHFYSIQGEGIYTGKPAYFIRFSGCDIGCQWCDSKDAWSLKNSVKIKIPDLTEEMQNSTPVNLVVITGGEPFIFNLEPLTRELKKTGKEIHIETSGAYPHSGEFDWLTLSPKKTKLPLAPLYDLANELKVVIKEPEDLEFAIGQAGNVKNSCMLLLQPEWKAREKILPEIIRFIKENPAWRLSLQTHKYLNIR